VKAPLFRHQLQSDSKLPRQIHGDDYQMSFHERDRYLKEARFRLWTLPVLAERETTIQDSLLRGHTNGLIQGTVNELTRFSPLIPADIRKKSWFRWVPRTDRNEAWSAAWEMCQRWFHSDKSISWTDEIFCKYMVRKLGIRNSWRRYLDSAIYWTTPSLPELWPWTKNVGKSLFFVTDHQFINRFD
jgi:hypothetical protein